MRDVTLEMSMLRDDPELGRGPDLAVYINLGRRIRADANDNKLGLFIEPLDLASNLGFYCVGGCLSAKYPYRPK